MRPSVKIQKKIAAHRINICQQKIRRKKKNGFKCLKGAAYLSVAICVLWLNAVSQVLNRILSPLRGKVIMCLSGQSNSWVLSSSVPIFVKGCTVTTIDASITMCTSGEKLRQGNREKNYLLEQKKGLLLNYENEKRNV